MNDASIIIIIIMMMLIATAVGREGN